MLKNLKNEIAEKCEKMNITVTGLEDVPFIVQGRPLFDFVGVDAGVLESLGQSEDDLFQGAGLYNIAVFPDGRVEGLKTVSSQYNLVQHLDAINTSLDHVPNEFELDSVDIMTSHDGGRIWAKFFSKKRVEVKKGDLVQLVSTVQNSCDASKVYRMVAQAMRLACTNGMVVPDRRFSGSTVKKLHKGGLDLEKQVSGFFKEVDQSIGALDEWKRYAEKGITEEQMTGLFEDLAIGPKVQESITSTHLRGDNTTVQALIENKNLTAWDLYNSFTQRITDSDSSEAVKIENGTKISEAFDRLVFA